MSIHQSNRSRLVPDGARRDQPFVPVVVTASTLPDARSHTPANAPFQSEAQAPEVDR